MDWSDDSNEIHEQAMRNWNGDVLATNRFSTSSITTDKITAKNLFSKSITDPDITSQTLKHTNAKRSPKRRDGEGKAVGHTWSIGGNLDYEWDGHEWLYRRRLELNRWEDAEQRQRRLAEEQKNALYANRSASYDYDYDPITFADSSILRFTSTEPAVVKKNPVEEFTKDTHKTHTTLEEILEHSEVEFHDYNPRQYYFNLLNRSKK